MQKASVCQKSRTKANKLLNSALYCPKYFPKAAKETRTNSGKEAGIVNLEDDSDDLSEHSNFSKKYSMRNQTISKSLNPREPVYPTTLALYNSKELGNPFSRNYRSSLGLNTDRNFLLNGQEHQRSSQQFFKVIPAATDRTHNSIPLQTTPPNGKLYITDCTENLLKCLSTQAIQESLLPFLGLGDLLNLCNISGKVKSNQSIQKVMKKALKQHIKTGLNDKEQLEYWKALIPFAGIKRTNPFVFINMVMRESKFIRAISKDVHRTLQDAEFFSQEKGRLTLFRVLIAISNAEPEVGYIQGLNLIIGTLLLYLKEEDAFWIGLYLLRKRDLRKVFIPPFLKPELWTYQLEVFMRSYLPDIFDYLKDKGMPIGYFSTPWFLTLYSNFLKTSIVIKIWNLYLLLGEKFLIQIALGILLYFRDVLITTNLDNMGDFFSVNLRELSSADEIIKLALDFKVTKRLLAQIENFHQKEVLSSQIVLQEDRENPLKMSFYEVSELMKEKPKQIISSIQLENQDLSANTNCMLEKEEGVEIKVEKSLLGFLPKENFNSGPYTFKQKLLLPISPKRNPLTSFDSISNNPRKNDSRVIEIEYLHNLSQSVEVAAQSNFCKENGSKTSRCTSAKQSNSSTSSQPDNRAFAPKEILLSPVKKRSDASSFVTVQPDEFDDGYFDERIKEDLCLKTVLFNPRATDTFQLH